MGKEDPDSIKAGVNWRLYGNPGYKRRREQRKVQASEKVILEELSFNMRRYFFYKLT